MRPDGLGREIAMLQESGNPVRPPDDGASPSASPGPAGERPPERIGPYRIEQMLGEGGLGVVYLAEQQQPLRRRVALKVLKTGLDARGISARFRAEMRALATLNHPNIAAALDAGTTEDGRPYCVMEYVPGAMITDYCDRNRLTVEERLALFMPVCAAIHHAHQKAIIHRDIKAANVLVTPTDGQPTPKVIDFGIVKALAAPPPDQPLMTHHGDLLGTPEYMSPEQAEMASPVDTRSDIYSLGALLYELLVGALPFDPGLLRHAGRDNIPRILRESDAAPLPTRLVQLGDRGHDIANRRRTTLPALRRRLSGEPDWIVAKAMDKDPARRYASASELAADIQRLLNHEPVAAGPGTSVYRARKFVQRRRPAVITAAIAAVAVLVGIVEISTGLLLQRRARIEAQQDVRRAGAVLEHLLQSIGEARPRSASTAVTVAGVLDAAAADVAGAFGHDAEVEASSHSTLGRLYHALGDRRAAETHLRRALVLRRTSDGPTAPLTVESMGHLGALLADDEQLDEAELLMTEALRISRNRWGRDDLRTVTALSNLGRLRERQGRLNEAAGLAGEALDAALASGVEDHRRLAALRRDYGLALMRQEKYEEAEMQLLRSLGDFKAVLGETHGETRRAGALLGTLYERWGMPDKAAEYASPLPDDPTL